jgi:hypothetical protein
MKQPDAELKELRAALEDMISHVSGCWSRARPAEVSAHAVIPNPREVDGPHRSRSRARRLIDHCIFLVRTFWRRHIWVNR